MQQPLALLIKNATIFLEQTLTHAWPVLVADNNIRRRQKFYSVRREQKFYSLPISDKNRFDVSSKGPSSGISVGGRGKHACFYTRGYIKTTRDKIKTNQMDLIKTRNK